MIPARRFGNRKFHIISIVAVGIAATIGFVLFNMNSLLFGQFIDNSLQIQQMEWFKANLSQAPSIAINTVRFSANFWIEGFYGKLGNLTLNFPLPLLILFYISLFVVFISEAFDSKNIGRNVRAFTALLLVLIPIILIFQFYITWAPRVAGIGLNYSTGIQGRYFIPLFIFTAFILMNPLLNKFKYKQFVTKITDHISRLVIFFFPMISVLFILMRYYMNK
jgi:hypothetical protein